MNKGISNMGVSMALLIKGIMVSGLLIAKHEVDKQLDKRGIQH